MPNLKYRMQKGVLPYPGDVIAIQTIGDFMGFNPQGHVLLTDGCFPEQALFKIAPAVKQMVRNCCFYNNVSPGFRQKENKDALIPL
jgi:hypothetical protein